MSDRAANYPPPTPLTHLQDGFTALIYACVWDYRPTVEVLLQAGDNKEAVTNVCSCPTLAAAHRIAANYVHTLDTCRSQTGLTALHMAAANGHKDCVELLLKAGVTKEVKDHVR